MRCLAAALAAILLTLTALGQGSSSRREVGKPMRVTLKCRDGSQLKGEVASWDDDAIQGTFEGAPGSYPWTDLQEADLQKTYRALMDKKDAGQWVNLGRLLLTVSQGEKSADSAFKSALAIDKSVASSIEIAKAKAADEKRRLAQGKLLESLPMGRDYGAEPWEVLTALQQVAATAEMRAEAEKICASVGVKIEPVETDYFLFYSELPREETSRWARELDEMYRRVARDFSLPDQANIFWGKAVVLIFPNQDRFLAVEAAAFQQMLPRGVMGLCHMRGPQVFVNMFRQPDELEFAAVLVHETVHGIMHRFLTASRMPTWANEGFSEYVASTSFRGSPVDSNRRPQALQFIRAGRSVAPILEMSYENGSWPGENAIGYAIGYVTVELMLRDRPRKFGDWVRAVKAGKDWKQALTEDFGVPVEKLAASAEAYLRTND